jgi:glycosyltransferase involved in cell wall biosynthesis
MTADPDTALRVAAVLPVRGHSALLDDCLAALRRQQCPLDEVIVVDDSPDASLPAIDGVRLLRSRGGGPYAARNVGWREADADLVLFLDVRSRPLPEWAARLVAQFEDPEVALAGSDTRTRTGPSLAAQASARQQHFTLRKYLTDAYFRPYLPTCNLAVRRADLEAVGGFREIRSGADADLCWRILDRPGRRLAAVEEPLLEWVPRDRVRDYLEQSYRYGKSRRAIRDDWLPPGAAVQPPLSYPQLARQTAGTAARFGFAALRRRREDAVAQLHMAARLAFRFGYRKAATGERRGRAA